MLAETDAIAIAAAAAPLAVAAALPAGFSGSVVTNSLPVLQRLVSRDRVRVVFLGGEFAPDTAAFVGPLTAQHAAGTRAADAVDPRGVYIHSDTERATVRALMDVADAVGLLAEHSAFSSNAPMQVCELQRLSSLITDRQPPARIAQAPDRAGVRTLVTTTETNLAGDRADGRRPNGSGRSV